MKDYLDQSVVPGAKVVVATKSGSGNAYLYTAIIDNIAQDHVYVILDSNGRRQKLYRYDLSRRMVVVN